MANPAGNVGFSLDDIHLAASSMLEVHPDTIVAWRLLREVLRRLPDDQELVRAKAALETNRWMRQLEQAQLPDGSWGRFHSQDTKQKTAFRTTEEAIDRAIALGANPSEGILLRVHQYILDVVRGAARITDRDEKSEAWPLGIRFILAGRLAQLDPSNPALDQYWTYLAEVARQAFQSGQYRLEDEVAAYQRLSGIRWPRGFLSSQHVMWILSSRDLPKPLGHELVNWIWHKPDGMGYLGAPLANFRPRQVGYWLRSMGILSRFAAWKEVSQDALNQLWAQRDEYGLWDFGSRIARGVDFPLSESWRHRSQRKQDYSTCILVLLRKYFD
ncbi:MAG TPA: hypothetical protein VF831_05355 [Anaerolineales bacterium]